MRENIHWYSFLGEQRITTATWPLVDLSSFWNNKHLRVILTFWNFDIWNVEMTMLNSLYDKMTICQIARMSKTSLQCNEEKKWLCWNAKILCVNVRILIMKCWKDIWHIIDTFFLTSEKDDTYPKLNYEQFLGLLGRRFWCFSAVFNLLVWGPVQRSIGALCNAPIRSIKFHSRGGMGGGALERLSEWQGTGYAWMLYLLIDWY